MNQDNNNSTGGHDPTKVEVPVVSHPGSISLEGMHGSVDVPHHQAGFWQQWRVFVGPAILSGRAAGVFFHEIFGHRVEGHRQKDENEGQTFTRSVNAPVLVAWEGGLALDLRLDGGDGGSIACHVDLEDGGRKAWLFEPAALPASPGGTRRLTLPERFAPAGVKPARMSRSATRSSVRWYGWSSSTIV